MFEKKQQIKEINAGLLKEFELNKQETISKIEEDNRKNLIKEIKEGKIRRH